MIGDLLEGEAMTVYNKTIDGYSRHVVEGTVWRSAVKESLMSQGSIPIESSKVFIFDYSNYIDSDLYDGTHGWTITVGREMKNTYIVKGVCDYNFRGNSNESVRFFEENYNYRRVSMIKDNRLRSRDVSHLVIIC